MVGADERFAAVRLAIREPMDATRENAARMNAWVLFGLGWGEQPTAEQIEVCKRALEAGWLGYSADPEDP